MSQLDLESKWTDYLNNIHEKTKVDPDRDKVILENLIEQIPVPKIANDCHCTKNTVQKIWMRARRRGII